MSLISLALEAASPPPPAPSPVILVPGDQPVLEGTGPAASPSLPTPPVPAPASTTKDTTLEGLTKYIPTETITLYVAGQAALQALITADKNVTPETLRCASLAMYWGLGALTPVVVLLLFLGELRKTGRPIDDVSRYPSWQMFASFVAFLVWALAVPGSKIVTHPILIALTGFGALLVSLILSLLAPVFSPPSTPPPTSDPTPGS